MSNTGTIRAQGIGMAAAGALLRRVVAERFGGRLEVRIGPQSLCPRGGAVWEVVLPGSEIRDRKRAREEGVAPDEPLGCLVVFAQGQFVVRHASLHPWERWVFSSVENALAHALSTRVFYDATGRSLSPIRILVQGTYEDWVREPFKAPIAPVEEAHIASVLAREPAAWREASMPAPTVQAATAP